MEVIKPMKLAEIFGNNMVLQREREICIFGTGSGKGFVEFCGTVTSFESEGENFRVYLPAQPAGGPHNMLINLDGEEITFSNILVGDVYIAAGQSNMEYILRDTTDIESECCPQVRLFTEPHNPWYESGIVPNYPGWQECDEKSAEMFSAIGYFVALQLYKNTGIPIGVISCNMGASRVDSWTAPEIVNTDEYQSLFPVKGNSYYTYEFNRESWLHIHKLLPIVPYSVTGVLWYQGESNTRREESANYAVLLETMIKNWRELFGETLPFYCVQIMPYGKAGADSDWAAVRRAQEYVSKNTEKVYLTTLVYTGEANLIHPTRKKKVATALSKAVLCEKYGICTEYCGPVYESFEKLENGVCITFTHADELLINGDYLEDAYVYDNENVEYTVNAEVSGNTLTLTWDSGISPARVTLGYANCPRHNLYNGAGYLASPFELIL